jgi:hypothetical protein
VVPARCEQEEAAVLKRQLAHTGFGASAGVLALQSEELAWERDEALHPDGIVLGVVNAKAQGIDGTATVADIERGGMLDGNAGYPVRALISGVVPDGVASVSLEYLRGATLAARVVDNVFVAVPPRHAGRLSVIVWRARGGAVMKAVPVADVAQS